MGGTVSWHEEDNSLKVLSTLIWGYVNLLGSRFQLCNFDFGNYFMWRMQ